VGKSGQTGYPPWGEGLGGLVWAPPSPYPPTLGEGLRPGNRALFSKDLGTFGRLGTPPRGEGLGGLVWGTPPPPLPPWGGGEGLGGLV